MHSLYYDAVATMTIDHVNHFEREGVVPIAFCLFHYHEHDGCVVHGDDRDDADLERRVAATG